MRARRVTLGLAFALMPQRIGEMPYLAWAMVRDALRARAPDGLPDVAHAEDRAQGFCGACRTLRVESLIAGYKKGMFPFAHLGPLKWWSTPRRPVLFFDEYRIEKKIRKLLRRGAFSYSFDRAFGDVIQACAQPRAGKAELTWIRPEIIELYCSAHLAGYAHSVEVWDEAGALAGGAYGTAVGGLFVAESQFYRIPNASKCGCVVLNRHLQHWGFRINDAKRASPFMAQQGFREMPRREYLEIVREAIGEPCGPARWEVDPGLDIAGWKPGEDRSPGGSNTAVQTR